MPEITRTAAAEFIPRVWDPAMREAWPDYAMARALGMTVEDYLALCAAYVDDLWTGEDDA